MRLHLLLLLLLEPGHARIGEDAFLAVLADEPRGGESGELVGTDSPKALARSVGPQVLCSARYCSASMPRSDTSGPAGDAMGGIPGC